MNFKIPCWFVTTVDISRCWEGCLSRDTATQDISVHKSNHTKSFQVCKTHNDSKIKCTGCKRGSMASSSELMKSTWIDTRLHTNNLFCSANYIFHWSTYFSTDHWWLCTGRYQRNSSIDSKAQKQIGYYKLISKSEQKKKNVNVCCALEILKTQFLLENMPYVARTKGAVWRARQT